MRVIGTDKNGDEIAEVSVTELDTMFKEIRAKAIDEFVEALTKNAPRYDNGNLELGGRCCYLSVYEVEEIAEQLRKEVRNE